MCWSGDLPFLTDFFSSKNQKTGAQIDEKMAYIFEENIQFRLMPQAEPETHQLKLRAQMSW